ncbi:MAG: hypothetical protein FJX94_04130 [Bacteroidetes bacterium]|nr:hypothetical protein [Bacteroidota bacterium]
MKAIVTTAAMLAILFTTKGQENDLPPAKYTTNKGWSIYAIVQPLYYHQESLNNRLSQNGLPGFQRLTLPLGIGFSYLFKTGTELSLDLVTTSAHRSTPESASYLFSSSLGMADFSVKQSVAKINQATIYAMAGLGGSNQVMSIERKNTTVTSFNNAILTNNVTQLIQSDEYLSFGIGIRALADEDERKAVTEYAIIEAGYRHQIGETWWQTQFMMLDNGPNAALRQFYISFKYGAFLKGKQKSKSRKNRN